MDVVLRGDDWQVGVERWVNGWAFVTIELLRAGQVVSSSGGRVEEFSEGVRVHALHVEDGDWRIVIVCAAPTVDAIRLGYGPSVERDVLLSDVVTEFGFRLGVTKIARSVQPLRLICQPGRQVVPIFVPVEVPDNQFGWIPERGGGR